MAKLYAELTSDKGGRVVGKGGNDKITTTMKVGNIVIATVTLRSSGHLFVEPNPWADKLRVHVKKA